MPKNKLYFLLCIIVIIIYFFVSKIVQPSRNKSKAKVEQQIYPEINKSKKLDISMLSKPIKRNKKIKSKANKENENTLSPLCLETFEFLNSKDLFDLSLDDSFWKKSLSCLKLEFQETYNILKRFFNSCKENYSLDSKNSICPELLISLKGALLLKLNPELLNSNLSELSDQELFGLYLGGRFNKTSRKVEDFNKSKPLLIEMHARYNQNKAINQYLLLEFGIFAKNDPLAEDVKDYFERNYPDDKSYLAMKYSETNDYKLQNEIFKKFMDEEYIQAHHIEQHAFATWRNEGKDSALLLLKEKMTLFKETYTAPENKPYLEYNLNRLKQTYSDIKNNKVDLNTNFPTLELPRLVPLLMGQER